ncbi:LA_2219 family laminin/E-cadherin/plasminogen-binding protein [Leptospira sp. SA-E8]|uniref:LA_2219 family laminin/E-cadherin/plasminogen-binding protein n=1 Tax=Leptospira sp. SA-E8 TaxID=3422259 RepID=UPI003EB90ED4
MFRVSVFRTFLAVSAVLYCLSFISCISTGGPTSQTPETPKGEVLPNPAGDNEEIIDEEGREVKISTTDPSSFQGLSKDSSEYFRVHITSESYQVRQIRGSKYIRRKVDKGGDALISEELVKYNRINFMDDGIILVILNGNTGAVETIRFNTRVPRINNLAKIIQNDVTRWSMEHSEEKPVVTKYQIHYTIKLENKSNTTRDAVKEDLRREVKKK